jgi:hypothetical protein
MEIELGGKKKGVALVSAEDYPILSKYKWHQSPQGYTQSKINGILMLMHRYIMKPNDNQVIDHINRNKLDNRRENLRITNTKLNNENRSLRKSKKTSKYRGVFFHKFIKKYQVVTKIGGKRWYLGSYKNEIKSAEIFDMFVVHKSLNHIELNFPEKRNEYLKRKYVPYNKKSKYIGVYKKKNKFEVNIYIGKLIYIKTCETELAGADAYDKYIVDNNIPGKKLNFPGNFPNYNPNTIIKTKCESTNNSAIVKLLIKNHPNKKVLIDKDNYDTIKYCAWVISNGYVMGHINGKMQRLHRFLMDITDPQIFVDHIDSNPLNNCKSNLRISNAQKNANNKSKQKNAASKYLGVFTHKKTNTWVSAIRHNFKYTAILYTHDELYAARARDLYIKIHFPNEHFKLNFVWTDKDIAIWKKKIITPKNNHKWTPKSHIEISNDKLKSILDALSNDNVLMAKKLDKNKTNDYNEKITAECSSADINFFQPKNNHKLIPNDKLKLILDALSSGNIIMAKKLDKSKANDYKSKIANECTVVGIK